MITSPVFSGKRYAILGLARSGMAVLESLHASGAELMAWDNREELRDSVADRVTVADPMDSDLTGYDAIIVSPGVPLNSHPIVRKAAEYNVPIIGDIELFAQARASLPEHKVIGITGTNGKSTTTALLHHIIESVGTPTHMGGNIGLPIMAQEPLPEGGVYVLELSSYQIDLTQSLDCDIGILLNITPDHLDRYDGFDGYAASKARLFDMMSDNHTAIIAGSDEKSQLIIEFLRDENRIGDVVDLSAATGTGQDNWPSLQGPHNLQNAIVAGSAAATLGINEQQLRAALASFNGLPHRMERIAELNGVQFINDSKATNPASTGPALGAYTKIHWILGGLPKSDNLDECAPFFGNVVQAYTIGEAASLFERLLSPIMPVTASEMMLTAVQKAAANAKPGEVILLSPACASFDQFKDFEARGDCFRCAANSVIEKKQIGTAAGEGA